MSAKINTIIFLFCWGKWKIAKIWFLFTSHLQIFFSKTTRQNFSILHTNSPWVCVISLHHLQYQGNNSQKQFENSEFIANH